MKTPFMLIAALFLVIAVSGCVNISPEDFAKANPFIQDFLKEHPNAKIILSHFTEKQANSSIEDIRRDCDNPYMEPKEYYRITVYDNETGFKAVVWIDWKTKVVECAYKEGGGKKEYPDKGVVNPGECKSHYKKKCFEGDVYWFDSCGNKQEKEKECENGCAEGACIGEECKSHAKFACYGQHVYWFDSCGNVQEKKEYCKNGCENGFCREKPKYCEDAGGYCEYGEPSTATVVACPEDAKLCPDGTSVGRVPPNCDFKPCPTDLENCQQYYECPNGEKVEYCKIVEEVIPGECEKKEVCKEVCTDSENSTLNSTNSAWNSSCETVCEIVEECAEQQVIKKCVCETPECPPKEKPPTCKEGYAKTDDYWCKEGGTCCIPETEHRALLITNEKYTQDPYIIDDVKIKYSFDDFFVPYRDAMIINVRYSGGCEEHDFILSWNGYFLKSYPPQVDFYLWHDNNDDACEAEISRTLVFDVTPLRNYMRDSEIKTVTVNLHAWPDNNLSRVLQYNISYVNESVECIFHNSTKIQTCYTIDKKYQCSGKDSCSVEITEPEGTMLEWVGTCFTKDPQTTTIDGNNETVIFRCDINFWDCQSEGETCGGIAGLKCCSGLECKLEGDYPDASGKCVKEEKCWDSDGGRNYYEKGVVETSQGKKLEDHCNDDGTLTEKFCSDGDAKAEKVVCENSCSDGACT